MMIRDASFVRVDSPQLFMHGKPVFIIIGNSHQAPVEGKAIGHETLVGNKVGWIHEAFGQANIGQQMAGETVL